MKEVNAYIALAERFSLELSMLPRRDAGIAEEIEGTHPEDTKRLESLIEKRLELDRCLFRIRNELDEASKPLIELLKHTGESEAANSVSRVTLAAWRYNGKFQSEWFACHALLRCVQLPIESIDCVVAVKFKKAYSLDGSQNERARKVGLTEAEWDEFKRKHRIDKDMHGYLYKLVCDYDGGKRRDWIENPK